MMGWGAGFGGMGWAGWLGPVFMVLFWAAVIGLAVWLVRALSTPRASEGGAPGSTALDTLKRRYAGGEITREEFEEGRRLLGA